MKHLCLALLLSMFVPAVVPAQSLTQSAPSTKSSTYFPVEDVRTGMRGYGVTTFVGSKLERFDFEILGVVEGQPNPRQRIILARLSGGTVDKTRVFAGMSGSPVYLDGRLLGAVAYTFAFATEPIAGITPIGQMVSQLRDIPQPSGTQTRGDLTFRDLVATRSSSSPADSLKRLAAPESISGLSAAAAAPSLSAYAGQSLRPIATPIAFGGVPQSVIDMFAPEFERMGLMAVAAPGGGSAVEPMSPTTPDTLKPGSSVVVSLVRGDYSAGASGTVTERDGDRIFAFGHPFLSLGATAMPMSESEVIVVVPNLNNSFKFATATRTVGSIGQDRSSGIGGQLGRAPKMIPVRVNFKNSQGETNQFVYEVIGDPALAPLFLNITLLSTVLGSERQIGDQTIDVRGTIRLAGQPEISLENRFAGSSNAAVAAALSIGTPLQLLLSSGFRDINVDGVDVTISASEDRNIGTLTRVRVDQTRVGRGDTVELQAFARTDDGVEYVERIPIVIPRDAPLGKLAILIGDGATIAQSDESFAGFAPTNLSQLVRAINKLKKNDRLYVKLVRASGGAVVENQAMTALPPSVLSRLESPRSTNAVTLLQTATIFEKELPPARFIVTGQQVIQINVVR